VNLAADGDLVLLDEELMLAGLEWRYLRKKGLSYAEEFASYEALVSAAMSRDGTKPILNMDGISRRVVPGTFIPSGSWSL
jgi:3-methyladenine DNA glycosylase Tag